LLFRDESSEIRRSQVVAAVESSRQRRLSLNNLLEARREGGVVGAVWGQVAAGRTAVVWPPRLAAGEAETTARRLLEDLDRRLREQGIRGAQSPLRLAQGTDATRLARQGYRHVADLLYLVSTLDRFPETEPPSSLQFEPFRESQSQRLMALIEQSYQQTLDIPALDDVRNTADVLAGYRDTGDSGPQHWLFARRNGQDVGCLLLSDHSRQQQMEVVYMGLTPDARGQRWGLEITRHAQWLTRSAGRTGLVLAVDAANGPAVATYAKQGFVQWDRRHVFLRVFDTGRF